MPTSIWSFVVRESMEPFLLRKANDDRRLSIGASQARHKDCRASRPLISMAKAGIRHEALFATGMPNRGIVILVCFACALSTAFSLFRREPHRRLSIVILIISCLIVSAFGPNLIRAVNGAVNGLRHQHDEAARKLERSQRPPADASPRSPIAPSADRSSSAPVTRAGENQQILELKSKLLEAIRAKNADAFVDCFFIEARFNTPEIRQENRDQVEILLRGETIDVEVRDIPARELVEIMKIQNAKPASLVRYKKQWIGNLRICLDLLKKEAPTDSVPEFMIG